MNTKPVIKLGFADFWKGFDPQTDYFTRIIRQHYDVEFSDDPDFLLYSVFGRQHLQHQCVRIFYTGENVRPDFRICDYAFTFDYLDRHEHFRLPYYARRIAGMNLAKSEADIVAALAKKTRFCSFVYTDPSGIRRNRFFKKLSRYKRVDSGGGHLNNVGGRVENKRAFVGESKFNIAFEHTSYPGYTTEKITDAMTAMSLPIYWGNPLVSHDFNTGSFLNAHEVENDEELIERIIELDRDDDKCAAMMLKPWFSSGCSNTYIDEVNILAQFDRIFETPVTPVALRRSRLRWWDAGVRPLARRAWRRADTRIRQAHKLLQR